MISSLYPSPCSLYLSASLSSLIGDRHELEARVGAEDGGMVDALQIRLGDGEELVVMASRIARNDGTFSLA